MGRTSTSSRQSGMRKALTYLRSIGGIGLFCAVVGMIQSTHYWWAVGLAYVAMLLLAIDLYLEPGLGWWKPVLSLMWISVALLGSVEYVFKSAPLDIRTIRHYGNFKDGEIIGGISWKPTYSELRIYLTNKSDHMYEDIDVLIITDLMVSKFELVDSPSNCSMRPMRKGVARTKGKDEHGKPVEEIMGYLGSYRMPHRVTCDKLLAHETVQVIFALVSGKIENFHDKTNPESWFSPKELPKWVTVDAAYKLGLQPTTVSITHQLAGIDRFFYE